MKPISRQSSKGTAFNGRRKKGYYPGSKPFLKHKIAKLRRRLEKKPV